jgi:hypothetical protein
MALAFLPEEPSVWKPGTTGVTYDPSRGDLVKLERRPSNRGPFVVRALFRVAHELDSSERRSS